MKMRDENKKNPIAPITVDGWNFTDDVEGTETEGPGPGRVIQGTKIAFTNEATWVMRDKEKIPPEHEFLAVDIARVVQKWKDGQPVETHILAPNEKVPNIKARNEACPKTEWREYRGNLQGPWQFQYVVYLLDPTTLDRFSYPTGTIGGTIAVHDLRDKTLWMRKFRGGQVCSVVTLSDTFMPTLHGGRQRPHFIIKRWMAFGTEKPALAAAPSEAEPPKAEPLPGVTTVAEPTLAEQMNDEIPPFDDPPDLNVPKASSPLVQPKPAATQTPSITKKGVQKIAGGRR
jgi:hypothetical protein